MRRNLRWFTMLVLVALGLLPSPARVHAENYAFLVAVQDYDVKDLKKLNYTRSDIDAFARTLQTSGFKPENIVVLNDRPLKARYMAESGKIRTELNLILGGVESGDTLVVAFSGHGVQFEGDDKNYYCPLDANLEDPKRESLIPLSEIYEKLKECPAEKKLLLVDACRNDPLSAVKKSRATVNLKSLTRPQTEPVPKGVVALFSCSAGQESYEWPDLKHGVFFHHVLEGWNGAAADDTKQVTLDGLVAYSRQKTQAFTRLNLKALQTPQLKSDFQGTWVLRKLPEVLQEGPQLGNWALTGKDDRDWGGTMAFTKRNGMTYEGYFQWHALDGKLTDYREPFRATFDSRTGMLKLQGIQTKTPAGVVQGGWGYEAKVTNRGQLLREGRWFGAANTAAGAWSADRKMPQNRKP